ncbi:MAG: hypothetical protein JNM88_04205 [Chitinophagaceae bacterium]|nr:hypothetical protein [Chitinophagaceae bacterium]
MKLLVKASYHIKEVDAYILFIKFIEGDKIKTGDTCYDESDPGLSFTMKNFILGTYNYQDKSFQIEIEKPARPLQDFDEKTFIKN